MNIKNFSSILSLGMDKLQDIFNTFGTDIENMSNTNQLNINSAEELMEIFVRNIKLFITQITGLLISNIDVDNSSNVIYNKDVKFKLLNRNSPIKILTSLGEMQITRDYYFSRSKSIGIGNTDKLLEISKTHKITKGLAEEIAFTAQKDSSFKEASETIKRYLDIDISTTQIATISEEIGKLLFEKDVEYASEVFDKSNVDENRNKVIDIHNNSNLYVLADGSMVSLIGKNNWKEMKLGMVFNENNVLINKNNMEINQKEYVAYLGSKEPFSKQLFAAALRAGYNSTRKVIALGDGAPWIWDMYEKLFPGSIKILDFYHFSENVNKYANWLYADDELKRRQWVNNIIDLSYKNCPDKILEEIRKVSTDDIKRPLGVVNLYNYISEKKDKINYGEYIDKGYIIGSGAIESGNKVVIQKRLKQSGMHWSNSGAQYISTLRAKYKSGLWHKVINVIGEEYLVG